MVSSGKDAAAVDEHAVETACDARKVLKRRVGNIETRGEVARRVEECSCPVEGVNDIIDSCGTSWLARSDAARICTYHSIRSERGLR